MTLIHNAVFFDRPDDNYVSSWREHILQTGYPETFADVSTTKPENTNGNLVLLSDVIDVQIAKREDRDLVPCPLCTPTNPKFKRGRMAWFTDENVVRFIGHKCAAKHYGDTFTEADKRWKRENEIRGLVKRWPEIFSHKDILKETAMKLFAVGDAIQSLRERIDKTAPNFAAHLYSILGRTSGRISEMVDVGTNPQTGEREYEQRHVGTFVGLTFLAKNADFTSKLLAALDALKNIDDPLPSWVAGQTDRETEEIILSRGRKVDNIPKMIASSAPLISDARLFLNQNNMDLFKTWFDLGTSTYTRLEIDFDESKQLKIRAESFAGKDYATPVMPKKLFDEIPPVPDVIVNLANYR